MAALTLVLIKRLTNRLPGCRPEVSVFHIAQVKVTSGLIHRNGIKAQTQKTSLGTRFIKTVTTRIVSNYSTINCRTKIITPARRCVRAGNYILSIVVIKITVFHNFSLIYISFYFNRKPLYVKFNNSSSPENPESGNLYQFYYRA